MAVPPSTPSTTPPLPYASTSLDHTETTQHDDDAPADVWNKAPLDDLNTVHRHSCWQARRARVLTALRDAAASSRGISRFCGCGGQAWVLQSKDDPDLYKLAPDFCRNRWCIPCARARGYRVAINLLDRIGHDPVRFVTLTIATPNLSLRDSLAKLLSSYNKLRRSDLWSSRVTGAVAFLEVTRGAHNDRWHPHLHVLTLGNFIQQEQLAAAWKHVTGDSYVVHIRLVRDHRTVVGYLCEYASKPIAGKLLRDPPMLSEAIAALRNRKFLYASGSCRHWQLLKAPTDHAWRLVGHLDELEYRSKLGDEQARDLLAFVQFAPGLEFGEPFSLDDVSYSPRYDTPTLGFPESAPF